MPTTGPDPGCLAAAGAWDGRPLETDRLRLRPPREEDIPQLVSLAGDWEVARYTAMIPHPYAEADARAFLESCARDRASGRGLDFALERREAPGLIGCVGAEIADRVATVGYWLGRSFWGQGLATEALRRVLRLLFAGTDVTEARAAVLPANPASCRVLEKAGLGFEGEETGEKGRCNGQPTRLYRITRDAWLRQQAEKPTLLVAAVALVDIDGRVLIAQRPEGKHLGGLWEFPGGKVKPEETPESALIRELDEELSIDVTESCLAPFTFASHAYDRFHLLMPLYLCRVWKGEVAPREGQRVKWVRPARLGDYPMPPADAPLVAMLRDWL